MGEIMKHVLVFSCTVSCNPSPKTLVWLKSLPGSEASRTHAVGASEAAKGVAARRHATRQTKESIAPVLFMYLPR